MNDDRIERQLEARRTIRDEKCKQSYLTYGRNHKYKKKKKKKKTNKQTNKNNNDSTRMKAYRAQITKKSYKLLAEQRMTVMLDI